MQGDAVWQIITFLLNSILFLLIGLQLPVILDDLRGADFDTDDLLLYGGAVTATVIVTRIVWTYVIQYSPYMFKHGVNRRREGAHVAIIAWMGMRGAVSLAAALALPTTTDAGEPFTERPVILFMRLLRDPRHARAAGPHAPVADPAARDRGRRQRRPRAGGPRPPPGGRGRARPHRRPRARGLDPRRDARAHARHLPLPPQPLRRALRRRRRRRRDRGPQHRSTAA